jgi:hypothetical protein
MIDRDELAPEARAQLESARAALSPDDVAIRRVRARIGAAIAAGAVVATVEAHAAHGAAISATSAAPVAAASIAGKLAAVVLAIGVAAGTGAVVVHRTGSVAVQAPIIAPSPSTEHEVVSDVPAAMPAHEDPAALPSAPATTPRHIAPPVAAPIAAVSPPPPPPAIASLARETELVDAASRALAQGQLDVALAAIARYKDETAGHGQLAEDASAIEIEARCKLGDARAADALAAFEARWPRSLEHTRLVAACEKVIE